MKNIYSNADAELSNMDIEEKFSDFADVSDCAEWKIKEREYTPSKRKVKSLMVTLILLLLGALTALSFLAVLYFSQSVSLDRVSEQYASATALLKMHENETTAKEREYKQLEEKHQRIHEVLSEAKKSCDVCDEGWRSLGLKCYFFSTNDLNWMESRDSCVEKGGHLVIITSQEEQDFLASQFIVLHWMGLNDLETEGTWKWVNNKTLDETGVKFWYTRADQPSEPDNWRVEDSSGENCACMGHLYGAVGDWFDVTCRRKQKYICEKQV